MDGVDRIEIPATRLPQCAVVRLFDGLGLGTGSETPTPDPQSRDRGSTDDSLGRGLKSGSWTPI